MWLKPRKPIDAKQKHPLSQKLGNRSYINSP
ncbi:hypothetical protein O77CONTIG1_00565 [Leptolyngbya sp. O-77]|nr:hypothetical protein O77CONTIG1_00565 [Leptolyngbya sp. O-77]